MLQVDKSALTNLSFPTPRIADSGSRKRIRKSGEEIRKLEDGALPTDTHTHRAAKWNLVFIIKIYVTAVCFVDFLILLSYLDSCLRNLSAR